MGSAEYEFGDQAKSLKRIFAKGKSLHETTVKVFDQEVKVYMLAIKGFPFEQYQPHLQAMAEDKLRLKEPARFNRELMILLKIEPFNDRKTIIDAWFDFENDVLWTISSETLQKLIKRLDEIKALWAEKEKAKQA